MVILALLVIPFLGTLFALSARRQIASGASGPYPFDRPFLRGLFYVIAFYIPVLGYFYHALPAWSLAYLIEPVRMPLLFGLVLASASFSGFFFFYLATQALLRARRPLTAWLAAAQAALAAATCIALFGDDLRYAGDYYNFHTGTAPLLSFDNGLAEVLIGLALLGLPALVLLSWNAREDSAFPPIEAEDTRW